MIKMKKFAILLVERTAAELEYTRSCLSHNSRYQIISSCTSCAEAYTLTRLYHPDLIICEMITANGGGIDLLRQIATMPRRPSFLLTSKMANDMLLNSAASAGADFFLMKPFTQRQLENAVQMILQWRTPAPPQSPSSVQMHRINRLLIDSGIPSHTYGYRYLASSLQLLVENPALLSSLTKQLYVQVAEIHHTNASRVERDMRHAIHATCERNGVPSQSNGVTLHKMLRILQREEQNS